MRTVAFWVVSVGGFCLPFSSVRVHLQRRRGLLIGLRLTGSPSVSYAWRLDGWQNGGLVRGCAEGWEGQRRSVRVSEVCGGSS